MNGYEYHRFVQCWQAIFIVACIGVIAGLIVVALGSSDEEEEPSWLGWQLCNFFGRLWFGSSVLGFVLWLMPYVWGSR